MLISLSGAQAHTTWKMHPVHEKGPFWLEIILLPSIRVVVQRRRPFFLGGGPRFAPKRRQKSLANSMRKSIQKGATKRSKINIKVI